MSWLVGSLLIFGWQSSALGQGAANNGVYMAYPLHYRTPGEVERLLGDALQPYGSRVQWLADAQHRQILLRGPDDAQQAVRQLLAVVDRPPMPAPAAGAGNAPGATPAARQSLAVVDRPPTLAPVAGAVNGPGATPAVLPAAPTGSPVLKQYNCLPGRQGETAEQLRGLFAGRSDVHIVADPQGPQITVFGPPDVQDLVARQIAVIANLGANLATQGAPKPEAVRSEQAIVLAYVRVDQAEGVLQRLLSPRLGRPMTARPGGPDYVYVDASGRRVEIRVDRQRNSLSVAGPEQLTTQFVRLVKNVDRPGEEAGKSLRIIPVRKADTTKIEEATRAYQSGRTTPEPDQSSGRGYRVGPINLTFYQAPQGAADAAGGGAVKAIPATDGVERTRNLLRALGSDVEVEMLPDLDVIILRGRERDVEEMGRIIEELERLSEQTRPVVEVYPLKNVGGESLTAIVAKVQDVISDGRQGRVSIIPLVKPNALLLIGWGDAVNAVKDVIAKLDVPVAPDAVFRVFPLRHAPVAAVRATVMEFFANRPGLNGRIQVSADSRTNSLLVNAPLQELTEVAGLIENLDRGDSAAVHQTRIFRLKFCLATDLAATLQATIGVAKAAPAAGVGAAGQKSASLELITLDAEGQRIVKSGLLADVQVTADPRLNTLIVTGPAESMGLIETLIHQLDAPVAAAQIKVFRVMNGDAASMVQMLRALLPNSAATTAAASPGPQLGMATDEASLTPLRFSIDIRTNSIIAVGAPADLKIVEAILLRLDGQDVQNRKNEVYRLKNSPAADVATAVNEFLRSKRQVESAAPGMASPFQQIESEVVVVPEPVSNSLIISATPRFFEEIHSLVEKLDAQPPQVLIQVLIAEVDLTNFEDFGMEVGLQDAVLFNRSVLSNALADGPATLVPGYNFNNQALGNTATPSSGIAPKLIGTQGLSNFNVGRVSGDRGYGGLVLSASSESVSVLLRALKETRSLEILARPQVMTLDNQPAYIQVGKRVPRIAGTSVTAATQVNSIVLENVGLILGVTPRISPDGKVVMELDAEKSKLGPEAEGIPVSVSSGTTIRSPSIDVTTAQTTVSANSGETIVLGGLITKEKEDVHRRIPFLGDLPWVGNLFGYKSHSNVRTELLIVMTPHVVRDAKDADLAKQIEAARLHWCLADVQAMHGDLGLLAPGEVARGGPVIYPDQNPRGILPNPSQAEPAGPTLRAPDNPEPIPSPAPLPDSAPAAKNPSGGHAPVSIIDPTSSVVPACPPTAEWPQNNAATQGPVSPAGNWSPQYPQQAEPVYHADAVMGEWGEQRPAAYDPSYPPPQGPTYPAGGGSGVHPLPAVSGYRANDVPMTAPETNFRR